MPLAGIVVVLVLGSRPQFLKFIWSPRRVAACAGILCIVGGGAGATGGAATTLMAGT